LNKAEKEDYPNEVYCTENHITHNGSYDNHDLSKGGRWETNIQRYIRYNRECNQILKHDVILMTYFDGST